MTLNKTIGFEKGFLDNLKISSENIEIKETTRIALEDSVGKYILVTRRLKESKIAEYYTQIFDLESPTNWIPVDSRYGIKNLAQAIKVHYSALDKIKKRLE